VLKERFADGARVRVRFGFLNAWAAEHHWQDIQEIEMHAISPDTWVATHQGQTVDLRGGFHFSHIEFAFLVVHPNGTVLWRNGGSNMGYYSAPIPKSSCARGELEVQPVETVKK
jgi:hypothetical protein